MATASTTTAAGSADFQIEGRTVWPSIGSNSICRSAPCMCRHRRRWVLRSARRGRAFPIKSCPPDNSLELIGCNPWFDEGPKYPEQQYRSRSRLTRSSIDDDDDDAYYNATPLMTSLASSSDCSFEREDVRSPAEHVVIWPYLSMNKHVNENTENECKADNVDALGVCISAVNSCATSLPSIRYDGVYKSHRLGITDEKLSVKCARMRANKRQLVMSKCARTSPEPTHCSARKRYDVRIPQHSSSATDGFPAAAVTTTVTTKTASASTVALPATTSNRTSQVKSAHAESACSQRVDRENAHVSDIDDTHPSIDNYAPCTDKMRTSYRSLLTMRKDYFNITGEYQCGEHRTAYNKINNNNDDNDKNDDDDDDDDDSVHNGEDSDYRGYVHRVLSQEKQEKFEVIHSEETTKFKRCEDEQRTSYVQREDVCVSMDNTPDVGKLSAGFDPMPLPENANIKEQLTYLEPARVFLQEPPSRPFTVCIDVPGTSVSHKTVQYAVTRAVEESATTFRIDSIQFVARNVILGTLHCDNRWLVTLCDAASFNALVGREVCLMGEQNVCRRFDEVICEEYRKFIRMQHVGKNKLTDRANNDEVCAIG